MRALFPTFLVLSFSISAATLANAVVRHASDPRPEDEIGLNIIIYEGDARDARVGANFRESGLGWAAFP